MGDTCPNILALGAAIGISEVNYKAIGCCGTLNPTYPVLAVIKSGINFLFDLAIIVRGPGQNQVAKRLNKKLMSEKYLRSIKFWA